MHIAEIFKLLGSRLRRQRKKISMNNKDLTNTNKSLTQMAYIHPINEEYSLIMNLHRHKPISGMLDWHIWLSH